MAKRCDGLVFIHLGNTREVGVAGRKHLERSGRFHRGEVLVLTAGAIDHDVRPAHIGASSRKHGEIGCMRAAWSTAKPPVQRRQQVDHDGVVAKTRTRHHFGWRDADRHSLDELPAFAFLACTPDEEFCCSHAARGGVDHGRTLAQSRGAA